jgi:5-methylcytosine-specific restriction endonuclease McrA
MEKVCKICFRVSSQEPITLTNGDVVHLQCESELLLRLQGAEEKLADLLSHKYKLEWDVNNLQNRIDQLSKTSLLSDLYESFFGERTAKEIERRRQLSQAQSQLQKAMRELNDFESTEETIKDVAEKDIKSTKEILKSVYDYWPGYPPDWDERRDDLHIAVGARCQRCGFKKYRDRPTNKRRTFHAHHKITISKGGSHKISNLKLLCRKCHQKVHPYNIGKDLQKMGIQQLKTKFTEKVALINKAIETQATLRFKYKKRNGQIMIREICPTEITLDIYKHKVRVVSGYCYLRNDTRTFTIARMSQLQINSNDGRKV